MKWIVLLAVLMLSCSATHTAPTSPASAPEGGSNVKTAAKSSGSETVTQAKNGAGGESFSQRCESAGFVCYEVEVFPAYPDSVSIAPKERWMAEAAKVHLTARIPVFDVRTGYGATEIQAESAVSLKGEP